MLERLLTQSRVLVIYLTQTFWPAPSHLSFFYDDLLVSRNLLEPPSTLLSLVFVVLVLSAAIALRDRFPLAGFGVAFFFAAHALESGPLPLELVFEHRKLSSFLRIVPCSRRPFSAVGIVADAHYDCCPRAYCPIFTNGETRSNLVQRGDVIFLLC